MTDLKDLKILVVEDDESLLEILTDFLRFEGSQVFPARHGKEAIDVLVRQPVDFVITDIQMPHMNGMELLEHIRRTDPKVPVVLLVTGQSLVTEEAAMAKGALGLVYKPFDFEVLKQMIRGAFAN